jgi:hypothetical protein
MFGIIYILFLSNPKNNILLPTMHKTNTKQTQNKHKTNKKQTKNKQKTNKKQNQITFPHSPI